MRVRARVRAGVRVRARVRVWVRASVRVTARVTARARVRATTYLSRSCCVLGSVRSPRSASSTWLGDAAEI